MSPRRRGDDASHSPARVGGALNRLDCSMAQNPKRRRLPTATLKPIRRWSLSCASRLPHKIPHSSPSRRPPLDMKKKKAAAASDGTTKRRPRKRSRDGDDVVDHGDLTTGEDLISKLPDDMLQAIISLLPTKDGARTQAIARRWRPLWRTAPLDLDADYNLCTNKFKRFSIASKILSDHHGPSHRFVFEWIPRHYKSLTPASLKNTISTVKVLALKFTVPDLYGVIHVLRCFPCLQKLYVTRCKFLNIPMSKTVHQYDPTDPVKCLEAHLNELVLKDYEGNEQEVWFAKFFVLNAKVLNKVKFEVSENISKEWVADQHRLLEVGTSASPDAQLEFMPSWDKDLDAHELRIPSSELV